MLAVATGEADKLLGTVTEMHKDIRFSNDDNFLCKFTMAA